MTVSTLQSVDIVLLRKIFLNQIFFFYFSLFLFNFLLNRSRNSFIFICEFTEAILLHMSITPTLIPFIFPLIIFSLSRKSAWFYQRTARIFPHNGKRPLVKEASTIREIISIKKPYELYIDKLSGFETTLEKANAVTVHVSGVTDKGWARVTPTTKIVGLGIRATPGKIVTKNAF